MARDYRGQEMEDGVTDAITYGDEVDVTMAHIVVAMAEVPSWGTGMEIQMAYGLHRPVFSICSKKNPSPWLKKRSYVIVPNGSQARTAIRQYILDHTIGGIRTTV
jgi:hypothetical protein